MEILGSHFETVQLTESGTATSGEAVEALLKICEGFRLLGPTLHHFREGRNDGTVLPNALSPIAPGMAWGYRGAACYKSLDDLEQLQTWKDLSVEISKEYERFCRISGNELLWAGWNYWDPTQVAEKQRKIQAVVADSPDLAELADETSPILKSKGFTRVELTEEGRKRRKKACPDVPDVRFGSVSALKARDLAEGTWVAFTQSVDYFRSKNLLTIADLLQRNFVRQIDSGFEANVSPVVFGISGKDKYSKRKDRALEFHISDAKLEIFWNWVDQMTGEPIQTGGAGETSGFGDQLIRQFGLCVDAIENAPESVPAELVLWLRRCARSFLAPVNRKLLPLSPTCFCLT